MRQLWKRGLEIFKNHRKQSLFLMTGIILVGVSIVFSGVYAKEQKVGANPNHTAEAETIKEILETPIETIVETAVETGVESPVETEILAETPVESAVEAKVEPAEKAKDVPVPTVTVASVNNAEDPEPVRQSAEEVDVSDLVQDEPVVVVQEKPKAPVVAPPLPSPVETPVVTVPVETPEVIVPAETPMVSTPAETPVVTTPVETPVIVEPAPVETPVVTTPPAPTVAPVIFGVDVSKWDGKIDWKQVKDSGIHFAMVRVGYRTLDSGTLYEDPYAKYNLKEAHANGVKVGAYFFSTAINELEVLEEAVWVSNFLKPYTISYPVAYDCEGFRTSRQSAMTIEERTNLAITFLDVVKSNGYTPLFYGSKYDLNNQWNTSLLSSKYKIWAAQYPSTPYPETPKSSYSGTHAMWQFTSNGTVPGINPGVDINIDYFGF
jgi:GH25 family lysozyme M1 (1,4-beta-N-acetylmuramidase)